MLFLSSNRMLAFASTATRRTQSTYPMTTNHFNKTKSFIPFSYLSINLLSLLLLFCLYINWINLSATQRWRYFHGSGQNRTMYHKQRIYSIEDWNAFIAGLPFNQNLYMYMRGFGLLVYAYAYLWQSSWTHLFSYVFFYNFHFIFLLLLFHLCIMISLLLLFDVSPVYDVNDDCPFHQFNFIWILFRFYRLATNHHRTTCKLIIDALNTNIHFLAT